MDIKHHLTDDVLVEYSAGTLPEAFSLVVATHISMCPTCRARMEEFDALGGTVVEEMDAMPMSDGSFEATMKRIANQPKDAIKMDAPTKRGLFPKPLQDYVGGDLDAVKWRPVGMGVKQAILKTSKDASVRLLYIPTGSAMPDHSHNGMEMTLVLQGAFEDEADHFGAGDVELADEDLNHTPVAVGPLDCICLAASDAPLKFNSLLPKVMQPFFRI
ncbi:ChrR family anti-sigma-E factor [Nereida sp. MMG025]|uniref:ChrR family anti-sigma-E factor n=1 Tax=Nereida sp. MMG025 TaxID=2909981 RepID=UPI001F00B99E|nr:ChrR family anti-sigma-E factor [Nereida sp. MMG025]MCF6444855.1 ChrR family anti-sigma-E factor [Nereida sp. MMG025]